MANFTEAGRGDLMNRCTTDLNSISQGVQRLFGQVLLEPLKMARLLRHRRLDQLAASAADDPHRRRRPATRSIGSAKRSSARIAKAMQELSIDLRNALRNAGRHQAHQSLHDGAGRAQQVPPVGQGVLPPPNADRDLQRARQPDRRNARHRDGAAGLGDGRLPRARPADAHPRHQDQRHRRSRTAR